MSEEKMSIEHWARERGHIDPLPPYDTGKGPRYAISDFKGWIYECVRSRCGSIGYEVTGKEYDDLVVTVLHKTLAR